MRVLLLHNRYRQAGGEDQAVQAEARLLEAHGVETLVVEEDNRDAGAAQALRAVWSRVSYRRVQEVCRRFRPDVAHVHNFWMKWTPAVHAACQAAGAATVQTLHNYRLLCPNALLLRDGRPCEDCVGRGPWRGVARRCYRGSMAASAAVAAMIAVNRRRGTWEHNVDAFVVLSEFARRRFQAGGLPSSRLFVKPNFVEDPGTASPNPSGSRVVLYAGRLSPEKGLGHLLGAWSRLGATPPGELLIAGDGPARQGFADLARVLGVAVRFLGFLSQPQLREVLASVRAVVLPSVCPENMPRSLVEAFSYGRPVIASDRGGLWEAVEHGSNGLQFRAGDEVELAAALRAVLEDGGLADRLGCGARASYLARYTPERNWEALQRIYRFALEHRCGAADRSRTVAAPLERRTVLGVNLTVATYREICRACRGWIEERRRAPARAVFACTVHSVMTGVLEPTFRALLNQAEVATPDGMPLVWALRSFGARQPGRVYGPNLMLFLCGQAARQGYRVYLYGGRPETLGELQRRLRARYPGLDIAGAEAPPFRPPALAEDSATVERILASGAELVFVGLGAPKQERWIAAHRERLPGLVLVGVGAAFDFHAGRIPQAPRWMQESGLEWLFRLCAEPRRLWKRYVLLNPLFLALWALQKTGLLRYPNTGSLP